MSHHLSQSARNTIELLQEVERDKELDILRSYLARFNLFPRTKDPNTAPIRFEELKELVKHWKLHRHRNFWKTHTTKEDLVRALHMYINAKFPPQDASSEQEMKVEINSPSALSPGGIGLTFSPSAPERKSTSRLDSPRCKSIGKTNETRITESVFFPYDGDKFGQRGTYENGIIYSSRLRKPLNLEDTSGEARDLMRRVSDFQLDGEASEQTSSQVSIESLVANAPVDTAREIRLKQECSFSVYHFSTALGNEKKMVDEGCVVVIARLAPVDDLKVKKYCAAALLNLTCDLSLCTKMIEDGALLALLELAKSQDAEIRRNTSLALCRFSYDHTGQQHLIQEGCNSVILSLLNSPDEQTKESCVKAIVNIASFSGAPIAESVVQTIVKKNLKNDCSSVGFITSALYNLSLLPGSRSKVVDENILSNLTELSQATNSHEDKENLATALCNYSGAICNFDKMCNVSVLECIEMLISIESEHIGEMCSIVIANLSTCQRSRGNLIRDKLFALLIELGDTEHLAIQKNIALIISHMSTEVVFHPFLVGLKVSSLMLKLLESGSVRSKQYALISLCNLVLNANVNKEFVTEKFLVTLNQLAISTNDNVKLLCANAIFNMTCDESNHEILANESLIQSMTKLLKRMMTSVDGSEVVDGSTNGVITDKSTLQLSAVQECALGYFCNLSFNDLCLLNLGQSDLVKELVVLFIRPCKNEDVMSQCAAIIANLSIGVACRPRMVEEGCIRFVRKLMQSTSKETLLCCAIAACNLAINAVEKTSVLSMLIDLSASQNTYIIATCAIAFSKLASQEKSRSILSKTPELFPALISMMRFGVEEIQIRSAATFCYLAMEAKTRTRHVWKEGTVPDFIVNSLLRINSASTKEICASALYNLLCHDDHRLSHIKDGILYALVRLARLERSSIPHLCADALFNLSCDPSMVECLMEVNVAQVVTKLSDMEFNNIEMHQKLACCLMKLSYKTGIEVRLVHDGVLTAISRLSKYSAAMPYCAAALCYLSKHRENCEAMSANEYMSIILALIHCDDGLQSAFALNALCNICCNTALHGKFQEAGAINETVSVLAKSTNDQVQIACTQILYNVVGNVELRSHLVHSNMIGALYECLSSTHFTPLIVDGCVEIIFVLCDDSSHWAELVEKGAVKVFCLLTSYLSLSSMAQCTYALSQLSQCRQYQLNVVCDGGIDIVDKVLSSEHCAHACGEHYQIADCCSAILRALSTCKEIIEGNRGEIDMLPLVERIVNIGSKEASQSCVITIYNLVMYAKPTVIHDKSQELIKLLIRLSAFCDLELAAACAIAVAHIQHLGENSPTQTRCEVQDGMVTTLLAMVDLNPASIQKVEAIAATPAYIATPIRTDVWQYRPGDSDLEISPCSVIKWTFHDVPITEKEPSPLLPVVFMSLLAARMPQQDIMTQDKIHGEFLTMKVHNMKCRVNTAERRDSVTTFESQPKDITSHDSSQDTILGHIDGDPSEVLTAQYVAVAEDLKKGLQVRKHFGARMMRGYSSKKTSDFFADARETVCYRNFNQNPFDAHNMRAKETHSNRIKSCASSLLGEHQFTLPKI